jgi:hypothetical protein
VTKCLPIVVTVLLLATLAACTGAVPGSSNGPASNGGAAVEGTVIDADGEPAEGVRVQIGETTTTTDVDGRFVVAGVAPTYDVALVAKAPHAYVFQALSTRTPTLRVFDLALSLKSHETRVHVKLAAPLPEGGKIVVAASPAEPGVRVADVHATPSAEDEGVDATVRWLGGSRARVRLSAIAYVADATTLAPSSYVGVASEDATLEHLSPAEWDAALAPVSADTVHAHAAPAPGQSMQWTTLYLDGGDEAPRIKIADRLGDDTEIDFLTPRLEGARFAVEAIAGTRDDLAIAAARGLDAGRDEARLALPAAPALRWPADGTSHLRRDAELSWEPRGGVSWVYVGPEDQSRADEPQVWIATSEAKTRLPDLRALGIAPASGAREAWYVVRARGAATVEDAAAAGLFDESPGAGGATGARRFVLD